MRALTRVLEERYIPLFDYQYCGILAIAGSCSLLSLILLQYPSLVWWKVYSHGQIISRTKISRKLMEQKDRGLLGLPS